MREPLCVGRVTVQFPRFFVYGITASVRGIGEQKKMYDYEQSERNS